MKKYRKCRVFQMVTSCMSSIRREGSKGPGESCSFSEFSEWAPFTRVTGKQNLKKVRV